MKFEIQRDHQIYYSAEEFLDRLNSLIKSTRWASGVIFLNNITVRIEQSLRYLSVRIGDDQADEIQVYNRRQVNVFTSSKRFIKIVPRQQQ